MTDIGRQKNFYLERNASNIFIINRSKLGNVTEYCVRINRVTLDAKFLTNTSTAKF